MRRHPFSYSVLAALALLFASHAVPAMALNCTQAPFGDSPKNYLQFSLDEAIVSKGNLKMALLIGKIGATELSKACFAKFQGKDVSSFIKMGLTRADLKEHSVTQLAAYAQAWLAEAASSESRASDLFTPFLVKT